ncbi:Zinc finger protein [Datura stramonium]|uniref:Zinc finger protein n=1 Tax=Datura stramonium TaxID=4076 RepID=A0ABS8SZH8_DATST|nr:Zinc finger protein [Datura stramonium]
MTIDEEDEDEAASWLLLNPPVKNNVNNNNNQNNNYGMFFGGEAVDDYLDLMGYGGDSQFNDQYSVNQQQQHYSVPQKSYGGDSVVPVRDGQEKSLILYHQQQQQQSRHLNFQLKMEYDNSNTGYGYPTTMSHSVSFLICIHIPHFMQHALQLNSWTKEIFIVLNFYALFFRLLISIFRDDQPYLSFK